MAYTGYLVNVYMDANPYSETYGQERTERVLDTENCPVQKPANYVEIYTYCEMSPNGAYTGNCVKVFEDVEPMSATYGQQREEVSTDGVLCPPDSAEADWQQINQYCEQIAYQPSGKLGNNGYQITVFQDMGTFSPTYQQTRETRERDIVHCPVPNTEPVWVEVRWECHLENGVQNGTKDVWMVNTNEYSPEYDFGAEVCFNVEDAVNCPRDEKAPIWSLLSSTCLQEYGYNTGYITEVFEDTNSLSDTYGQTKTVTRLDVEDCPVQEPDIIRWTIINNRSASTDTITSATLHLNNNFDITANGSITPVGGSLSGSTIIPADLKSSNLIVSSVDLTPNTTLPVLYQFSQNPNPYVWSSSNVLTITIWDGDGTGPEWTETSYSCETVNGYRTGAAIVVEEDVNPNSGTYGQTRTRTIENDSRCPAQTDADWVETSWTCEQVNGFNTGNRLSVQTDQNPNSSTYNQTRTRIIADSENCPVDTTANWVEISYVCEQVDGHNSGYITVTELDNNPGSATYNTTRTRTYEDNVRCPYSTEPDWVEESWSCETATTQPVWEETSRICEQDENDKNTGNIIITETDINPYSETYNQTRTSTERDLAHCTIFDNGNKLYVALTGTGSQQPRSILCDGDDNLPSSQSMGMANDYYMVVGNCVSTIGDYFHRNTGTGGYGLRELYLPDTITTIGYEAFYGVNCLAQVYCYATTPPVRGSRAFMHKDSQNVYDIVTCTFFVPAESVEAYKQAWGSNFASHIYPLS